MQWQGKARSSPAWRAFSKVGGEGSDADFAPKTKTPPEENTNRNIAVRLLLRIWLRTTRWQCIRAGKI